MQNDKKVNINNYLKEVFDQYYTSRTIHITLKNGLIFRGTYKEDISGSASEHYTPIITIKHDLSEKYHLDFSNELLIFENVILDSTTGYKSLPFIIVKTDEIVTFTMCG